MERKRLINLLKELVLSSNVSEKDKAEMLELINEMQIKSNN